METSLDEFDREPSQRPSLLTVLCILTFIGSGWGILSHIWAYNSAGKTAHVFESRVHAGGDSAYKNDTVVQTGKRKRLFFEGKMMASVSKLMTVDNIRKNAIGGTGAALLTLSGAILMWMRKRKGFYLYILGTLAGLLIPFYLYGGNLMAVGISVFSGFFGLVFIALYALNWKAMDQ